MMTLQTYVMYYTNARSLYDNNSLSSESAAWVICDLFHFKGHWVLGSCDDNTVELVY